MNADVRVWRVNRENLNSARTKPQNISSKRQKDTREEVKHHEETRIVTEGRDEYGWQHWNI